MKPLLLFLHICLSVACYAQLNTDSLDKANANAVKLSGGYITKAVVDRDSSIWLQADMKRDHRFFGYEKPDRFSRRLLLFSIFTDDVEKNPFECKYGAYYETSGLRPQELQFVSLNGRFIKAKLVTPGLNASIVYLYFEKKWFVFKK